MTKPTQPPQPVMLQINEQYGQFIWGMANRYRTGIWSSSDVYQQLLIMAYSAVVDGTLSLGDSDHEVGRFKSFLITRAINIIRYESRRQQYPYTHMTIEQVERMMIATPSPEAVEFETELIKELLHVRLDEQTATFICELAFPSQKTIDTAKAEQDEARQDAKLRMNVHDLKILPKHAAQTLAQTLGRRLPKVTISRIRGRARRELYKDGTTELKL